MTRLGAMIKRDVAPEDVPALAAAAAPGLDELWIIEDLTWAGGISQLAAVLQATDSDAAGRPKVDHRIAPAPFHNPAALAMEWATLARLHPGRVIDAGVDSLVIVPFGPDEEQIRVFVEEVAPLLSRRERPVRIVSTRPEDDG